MYRNATYIIGRRLAMSLRSLIREILLEDEIAPSEGSCYEPVSPNGQRESGN